jgi:hypothetical protein
MYIPEHFAPFVPMLYQPGVAARAVTRG